MFSLCMKLTWEISQAISQEHGGRLLIYTFSQRKQCYETPDLTLIPLTLILSGNKNAPPCQRKECHIQRIQSDRRTSDTLNIDQAVDIWRGHLFLVLHCLRYIYTCYQVSESLNGRYLQKKLIFLPFGFE